MRPLLSCCALSMAALRGSQSGCQAWKASGLPRTGLRHGRWAHASSVLSTCSHPAAVTCVMDRCRHMPAPVACRTSGCVQLTEPGAHLQTWSPGPNNFNLMIARDRSVHGHTEDAAGQEPQSPRGGSSAWAAGAVPDRSCGGGPLHSSTPIRVWAADPSGSLMGQALLISCCSLPFGSRAMPVLPCEASGATLTSLCAIPCSQPEWRGACWPSTGNAVPLEIHVAHSLGVCSGHAALPGGAPARRCGRSPCPQVHACTR